MQGYGPNIGLYFHIPFCSRICSYCDFSKTSIYTQDIINSYVQKLSDHFNYVKDLLFDNTCELKDQKFYSMYLGGGTPSLITHQYEKLFDTVRPYLKNDAEITLEANPQDINHKNLKIWSSLGINRLSIGVQSFNQEALRFLTREPLSVDQILDIISISRNYFSNLNIDLIYSLPIANHESIFFKDLDILTSQVIPEHISLYCLSYSSKTPLGLREKRGIIKRIDDDTCADIYEKAIDLLQDRYIHEEVSNWYLPSYPAKHSNLYWSGGYYLGIGPGASGYLPQTIKLKNRFSIQTPTHLGWRYTYNSQIKAFLDSKINWDKLIQEDVRSEQSFLYELLGSTLRSRNGLDLKKLESISGYRFIPTSFIKGAISQGILRLEYDKIFLDPSSWFLEMSWAKKLIEAFKR